MLEYAILTNSTYGTKILTVYLQWLILNSNSEIDVLENTLNAIICDLFESTFIYDTGVLIQENISAFMLFVSKNNMKNITIGY